MSARSTFIIKGSKDGKPIKASVGASSEQSARNKAHNAGITVASIEQMKPIDEFTIIDDESIPVQSRQQTIATVAHPAQYGASPEVHLHAPTVINRGVSGFGIAALVLGIVAIIFAWVPFIGLLAVPIAAIGVLIAIVGVLISLAGRRSGVGMPVAGGFVCGLAIAIALFSTGGTTASIAKAITDANNAARSRAEANTVTSPSDNPFATNNFALTESQESSPSQSESDLFPSTESDLFTTTTEIDSQEQPPSIDPNVPKVMPDGSIVVGETTVRVMSWRIGYVSLKELGDDKVSADRLLMVRVRVTNNSRTKRLLYSTWGNTNLSFERDYGTVLDEYGNTYQRINFGIMTKVVGRVEAGQINPDDSLDDLLVFEVPIEAATKLILELPGRNINAHDSTLRFEVDRSKVVSER